MRSGDRLVAGLSGGVDSAVLLELLRRLSGKHRFQLAALHVNHQINPAAGRWAAFCRAFCRRQGIPLTVVRVTVPRGDSLEAAARHARYRAFAQLPADFVALAHNLDDQAETVFLQLLRGAGVKGVSAMPVVKEDRGEAGEARSRLTPAAARLTPSILRPLLEIPRSEIESYARRRGLEWIEDDSNADTGFDRNFLRHCVMPLIAQRYPSYRGTLLRASRNFAEAAGLLDDLAKIDGRYTGEGIDVETLRALSAARAKNVLRHLLAQHGVDMPNAARLNEYVRQLQQARSAKRMVMDLGGHELRSYAREVRVVARRRAPDSDFSRVWRGESKLSLPELGGTLALKKCRGAGISLARLISLAVTVRRRIGGERLRPHAGRPRRSLKNLLQEARIPPWLRDRLPLLFCGQTLVYVPGIGIDIEFRAAAGEVGVQPTWEVDGSTRAGGAGIA